MRICVGAISWQIVSEMNSFCPKKILKHKFFAHLFLWIFFSENMFTKIYLPNKICNDDFFSKNITRLSAKKKIANVPIFFNNICHFVRQIYLCAKYMFSEFCFAKLCFFIKLSAKINLQICILQSF